MPVVGPVAAGFAADNSAFDQSLQPVLGVPAADGERTRNRALRLEGIVLGEQLVGLPVAIVVELSLYLLAMLDGQSVRRRVGRLA